ncbi:MAG: hypothetical protein K0R02_881 [Rickettsiaceae bacterium]|jgi:hypothetical protein|nr:hypothetical protein [Rickettsiaceae bacterium]
MAGKEKNLENNHFTRNIEVEAKKPTKVGASSAPTSKPVLQQASASKESMQNLAATAVGSQSDQEVANNN